MIHIALDNRYHFVNKLIDEFEKTAYTKTSQNYLKFLAEFSRLNNMQVIGNHGVNDEEWRTTGLEFETPEDWLMFKLKYDV